MKKKEWTLVLTTFFFCILTSYTILTNIGTSQATPIDQYSKCFFEYYVHGSGFVIPVHNLSVEYTNPDIKLGKCEILKMLCIEKQETDWGGCVWIEDEQACDCDVNRLQVLE